MQILSSTTKNMIRSLYLPEATLTAIEGVAVYLWNREENQTEQLQTYVPGTGIFQFYEVSEIKDKGSWWSPSVSVNLTPFSWNNSQWGGLKDLLRDGPGIWEKEAENRMVMPKNLFWWLPLTTLVLPNFPVSPARHEGSLRGAFPQYPPGGKPQKPTVEPTDDGYLITVPPTNQSTTITVAK